MSDIKAQLNSTDINSFLEKTHSIWFTSPDSSSFGNSFTSLNAQFWPESINDQKQIAWTPIELPGGTHPVYQFAQGGERIINMSLVLYRERLGVASPKHDNSPHILHKYSRDISASVSWLRHKMYPYFDDTLGIMKPPPRLRVYFGGTGRPQKTELGLHFQGLSDNNVLDCILTACDVSYTKFFPNGTPRLAMVEVALTQIIQVDNDIRYPSSSNFQVEPRVD